MSNSEYSLDQLRFKSMLNAFQIMSIWYFLNFIKKQAFGGSDNCDNEQFLIHL